MIIEEIKSDDKLQLNVQGKIDAMSSNQLQTEILKAFQKCPYIILNFAEVSYISSAGLRALLIGQKTASSKGGKLLIINPTEAVQEVLNVTGLTKMFDVK